ncbi:MAG: enoyl-CoA hydratase/isomerase family protein [Bacteroidetes bacterium]|nr:enoyl-CoA hydratase/isomerase family protein [Bacteroidota bacterium]
MEYIRIEKSERIANLILARPEKRNALNQEMVTELKSALTELANDTDCRAVIIKSDGQAFCAGADLQFLQNLQNFTFDDNYHDSSHLAGLFEMMYRFPKYLITQVEGPALAGGCGLATLGDFCFSTPEATFGYTEARIGFVPAIVMIFLLRKLGDQKARELMLTADILDARKAIEAGLIYQVDSSQKIDETVRQFALKMISRNSAESVRRTKEMLVELPSMDIKTALDYAARMNATARESADCKKGIAAFLNKQKPQW